MTGVSKEVFPQLQNEPRVCRRKPGELVYPIKYEEEKDLMDVDIWNNMWIMRCCEGGVSMHQFSPAPTMILDLGCGSGYWTIEAAKQFPEATVIGFDFCQSQPPIENMQMQIHRDLAPRVKWMHGNLLDSLPFAPDFFDYVRVAGIGLGVPEDEWQYVLEEISRVMKPGGVLELLEDDLLFPSGDPPSRPRPRPPPINVDLPPADSLPSAYANSIKSASTLTSESWSDDTPLLEVATRRKSSFIPSDAPSIRRIATLSSPKLKAPPAPPLPPPPPPPVGNEVEEEHLFGHPQDHTRLRESWETMLAKRFLSRSLVSVLPFYLSSCFEDIQSYPTLHVPLPPNSGYADASRDSAKDCSRLSQDHVPPSSEWTDAIPSSISPRSIRKNIMNGRKSHRPPTDFAFDSRGRPYEIDTARIPGLADSQATRHLAKTVQTVRACKEAIWAEYKALYGGYGGDLPPVTDSSRPELAKSRASKSSAREDFEGLWQDWENDMMDRMGLRDRMNQELTWMAPPGDRPDWVSWRNNVGNLQARTCPSKASLSSYDTGSSSTHPTNIARSFRAFLAWKPL